MDKEIVYIAELDADVDDVVAAEYLHRKGFLREVVCDPVPSMKDGRKRREYLEGLGVKVSDTIPDGVRYLFVGGALTKAARYLEDHEVYALVMNGGFVGCNIRHNPLPKFEGLVTKRTFNFNMDVDAADRALRSKNVEEIMLVGKNVCHDDRNSMTGIWKDDPEVGSLLRKHKVRPSQHQHDLLACREGLVFLGMLDERPWLTYGTVYPYNTGLDGNRTKWGSTLGKSPYRQVVAAIDWR